MLTSMTRLLLSALPAFSAVARLSNLRAAAEELHLTHSAVSQQIRTLETQLGVQLFDRRGRRIALNAAGTALLRAVDPALAQLADGVRAATAADSGAAERIRVTVPPSFAQRWWLPRMASWQAAHPNLAIELHTSQQVMDLQRDGFHAALRQGPGPWRGLASVRLLESPLIVLGSPSAARRLLGRGDAAIAGEPLLGNPPTWKRWFALAGVHARVDPVATFNDAGMMLQAVEQDLGLAIARELLAADALCDGRLMRLSPLSMIGDSPDTYWLVHPPALRDWPPLVALKQWLARELAASAERLNPTPAAAARKRRADAPAAPKPASSATRTAPANRSGSPRRAP